MPRRKYWKKSKAQKNVGTAAGDMGVLNNISDEGPSQPLPSYDGSSVSLGVLNLSDGGLSQPLPSSVSDDGPSVSRGHQSLSDEGLAIPKKSSVSWNNTENSLEYCLDLPLKKAKSFLEPVEQDLVQSYSEYDSNQQSTSITKSSQYEYFATPLCDEATDIHSLTSSVMKPYNSKAFIFGSFDQCSSKFSENSRGSQCTVISLCSLVYAKYFELSTKKSLDDVLLVGDALYNEIIFDLNTKKVLKSKLLNFDEIPTTISLFNRTFYVEKLEVISGVYTQQLATEHLPSLFESLYTAFQISPHILFMIGSVCSALFQKDQEYYIFDSHSHGSDGLSYSNGKSLLASFSSLEDLVTFMYALYDSMLIDLSAQFDMMPIHLIKRGVKLNTDTKNDASENIDRQTVSNTEHKTRHHTHYEINTKVNESTEIDQSGGSTKPGVFSIDDKNDILMKQYLKDQKNKSELYKINKSKHSSISDDIGSSRTMYHRLYKQKQRLSLQFKQKESISKRQTRDSLEHKKKEQAVALNSKRKARKSDEFKRKERESKQASRNTLESKRKERVLTLKSMRKARKSDDFKRSERESKQASRNTLESKKKERVLTLKSMRKARISDDFKRSERESKQASRNTLESKKKERVLTLKSMRKARKSDDFKRSERESKQASRNTLESKKKERVLTLKSMRKARKSDDFKRSERESKQASRNTLESKKKERAITLKSKRKARESEKFREKENASKRRTRSAPEFKLKEAYKKQLKREEVSFKQKELFVQRKSKRKARQVPQFLERERAVKQIRRSNLKNKSAENALSSEKKRFKRKKSIL